jgi:hypothetical protein
MNDPIGPRRSQALDLLKTMLIVGMVATHVIQLVSRSMPAWTNAFADVINLLTFSGFLFAFGLGLGLSRGDPRSLAQRLRPAVLLLLAAYISSFAFATLVDREPVTIKLILDIVTLRRLFGWSEFLATFAVLYLLLAVARPLLIATAIRPWALAVASLLCMASTMIVLDAGWPIIPTLLGTTRFASFPLLPYLPWLLFGIAMGRRDDVPIWLFVVAAVPTAAFYFVAHTSGQLPERFPPTALWILGPAWLILVYWQVTRAIGRWTLPSWMVLPGRHVLSFLLLSNLALFTVRRLWGRPVHDIATWLPATSVLLATIGLIWLIVDARQQVSIRRQEATASRAQ